MNDFPFIPDNLTETPNEPATTDLPIFAEWAFDFDRKELLLKNGRPYLVYKNEALKIWIWKALNPHSERYVYNAYTFAYGNEFNTLLARFTESEVKRSELKRIIKDALLVNPYIKECTNFNFEQSGSKTRIEFDCITVYGKTTSDMEIE